MGRKQDLTHVVGNCLHASQKILFSSVGPGIAEHIGHILAIFLRFFRCSSHTFFHSLPAALAFKSSVFVAQGCHMCFCCGSEPREACLFFILL